MRLFPHGATRAPRQKWGNPCNGFLGPRHEHRRHQLLGPYGINPPAGVRVGRGLAKHRRVSEARAGKVKLDQSGRGWWRAYSEKCRGPVPWVVQDVGFLKPLAGGDGVIWTGTPDVLPKRCHRFANRRSARNRGSRTRAEGGDLK